jgi:hypothetical protein
LEHESAARGLYWIQTVFTFDPDNARAHEILADYFEEQASDDPKMESLAEYHRSQAKDRARNN